MMENKTCFLFTGGNEFYPHLLYDLPTPDDFIIAVDSGVENLRKTSLTLVPNLIIGDMDSYSYDLIKLQYPNTEIIKLTPEKDDTDTMFSIKEALLKGFHKICIIGGIGGRADHTFANAFALKFIHSHGAVSTIDNGKNRMYYLENGSRAFNKAELKRHYVSIVPMSEKLENVTITGFKYPLTNAVVDMENVYTVSNELVEETGVISIGKGGALILECSD
jgi:thiamine pyrophosphokinase